ncbi:hypothetical protein A8144_06015 [Mycobacterium leprae 3125609]|nr:hypothetical protein A8144_06015 [Mycobacterium leprae 3125609]OAX71282.1 hypothetical protein A3216_06655 [Mycobacterium leprae 7935681]
MTTTYLYFITTTQTTVEGEFELLVRGFDVHGAISRVQAVLLEATHQAILASVWYTANFRDG